MNLALIGLGPHAKRIYLRFLLKHNIEPALIVDLVSQENAIRKYLGKYNLDKTVCVFVDDRHRDDLRLSKETESMLAKHIKEMRITHAII